MIRNTPYGRQSKTSDFVGLIIMILVSGALVIFGAGILLSCIVGFVVGLVAMVLVFRGYKEEIP